MSFRSRRTDQARTDLAAWDARCPAMRFAWPSTGNCGSAAQVCAPATWETASKPIFDTEGFLATGDYASIDAEGFITLTGRKSDIFKTSTGRRIAPAGVEACLRAIPYVEHAVLVGAGRPFPVAIVAVSEPRLRACAGASAETPIVRLCEHIFRDVARSVSELPEYQRPAGVVATVRTFTIEGGELTPNLKLRRQVIEVTFAAALDELYRSLEAAKGIAIERVLGDGKTLLCS